MGLLSNPRLPQPALEEIHFQNGKFYAELTQAFEQFADLKAAKLPESGLYEQLAAVIHKHTNFKITVVNATHGPAISVPMMDKNHVLLPTFMRWAAHNADGKRMIAEAGGLIKGEVNLKTGKVSGMWADLDVHLIFPAALVASKELTAQEMAAIVLHEVGHFFVYCEFITHTVTTNYVLAGMARELDGSGGPDEREQVLVSVKKALQLKDLDTKMLAHASNNKVVETVVITGVARRIRSELGSDFYDNTSFEALADQYAARQGAAGAVVSGLDKMNRAYAHRSYLSTAGFWWYEALKFVLAVNPLFTVIMLYVGVTELNAATMHEPPEARFQRLRNQLVEQLKNRQLTAATYQKVKADLLAIDRVLREVNDRRTVFQVLFGNSHGWDQMKLQKELELLAANDLFVKAQELSRLA